jgi:two-component system NtrC family sensor kinase
MKILVADDEAISRRLLQNYLQKWGHEVVVAENGAEAWALFEADEFPIVLSDWMMPEMDGLELIRRIRASKRTGYVYVILLTAKSQKDDVVEGMEAGADDFLSKPFDRDELRVRLWEGERIMRLEQTLAEQNRALDDTRDNLDRARARLLTLRDEVLAAIPQREDREGVAERFDECLDGLAQAIGGRAPE